MKTTPPHFHHAIERYPFMNTTLSFDSHSLSVQSNHSQHQPSVGLYDLYKVIQEEEEVESEEIHQRSCHSPPQLHTATATDDSLPSYVLLMNSNRRNSFNTFSSLETIYEEEEQPKISNQPLY